MNGRGHLRRVLAQVLACGSKQRLCLPVRRPASLARDKTAREGSVCVTSLFFSLTGDRAARAVKRPWAPGAHRAQAGFGAQVCFELGRPFLPFQQLLGVLPIASKKLLPRDYAALMDSPSSALNQAPPAPRRALRAAALGARARACRGDVASGVAAALIVWAHAPGPACAYA